MADRLEFAVRIINSVGFNSPLVLKPVMTKYPYPGHQDTVYKSLQHIVNVSEFVRAGLSLISKESINVISATWMTQKITSFSA